MDEERGTMNDEQETRNGECLTVNIERGTVNVKRCIYLFTVIIRVVYILNTLRIYFLNRRTNIILNFFV